MKRNACLFLPALILLAACQREADPTGLLPEEDRAPQFDEVSDFLDLGGVFYGYMDLTGEVDDLGTTITEMAGALRESVPEIPPLPLDFQDFFSASGLSGLQAIGMSSREVGEGYFHNRSILFFPEGVGGLFRAFGDAPLPFDSRELASSGADLVFETGYDAVAVRDSLLEMVEALAGPEEREKFASRLSEPIPDLEGRSINELVDSMGTRMFLVFEFAEDGEEFFFGPGLSVPEIRYLVGVDGITDLLTSLRSSIESEPDLVWKDTDTGFEISTNKPLPSSVGDHTPLVVADTLTGRTLMASSRGYLEAALASGDKLKNTEAFRNAANMLPSEGVSFTYIAPGLFGPFRDAFETGMSSGPAPIDGKVVSRVTDLLFAGLQTPTASVTTVGPEGLYSASNSASSHRTTVVTLAAQPVTMIGLTAAMAIPAFQKVRETSRQKTVVNNLRQIASGGQQYLLEEGATSVGYSELEGEYFPPIQPVAGEDYTDLVVEVSGTLSVTLDNGEVVEYAY